MTTVARTDTVARRFRRIGGRWIQRLGLLPAGVPDARGDDAALVAAGPMTEQVVVYFGSTADTVYQLEQWLPVLEQLDAAHPVLVVTADSRSARRLRELTRLRVVTVARYATFDDVLAGSDARLALYVNHHVQNFSLMRFAALTHVSLLHGDSDKVVSVSNQAKAYDFTFVAGRAAVDRLDAHLRHFDAAARCVVIGRPQAAPAPRPRRDDDPITVLYAPTWEGAQTSAAYGSLPTHGVALARAVAADPGLRLVYRPHPLTGVRSPEYGEADAAVRSVVAETGQRISAGGPLAEDFAAADVLVCDVSAVAVDWLATGRPLVLTQPGDADTPAMRGALAQAVTRLPSVGAVDAAALLRREVELDERADARREVAEYYLGDISPGSASRRFLEACEAILAGGEPPTAGAVPEQADPSRA
ncbi:CDP-glycerol glycerophosphotransferase family protein [Cellulomonas sp. PhB150]|uniref:CDP-glycerol glycerophosphotransferase family protein n=1 Tax=Cellulomonas sp. PhB150 TaxID=2485188 RepID=UPI001315393F|nr:CDP-glycerol glycerophosphotransferase family protein [Cellulomonas sp. PhB150]